MEHYVNSLLVLVIGTKALAVIIKLALWYVKGVKHERNRINNSKQGGNGRSDRH